jgi:hypothetical protein
MTIVTPSRDDLIDRRRQVLGGLSSSESELRDAAVRRALSSDEWEALENLDAIAFLLGEAPESDRL